LRVKTETAQLNATLMALKTKTIKSGLCVKCGQPAQIHSRGKRAGSYSIYCLGHLLEQREKNRARSELNRWIQSGGDPAAWAAVAAWKAGESRGYHFFHRHHKKMTVPLSGNQSRN